MKLYARLNCCCRHYVQYKYEVNAFFGYLYRFCLAWSPQQLVRLDQHLQGKFQLCSSLGGG